MLLARLKNISKWTGRFEGRRSSLWDKLSDRIPQFRSLSGVEVSLLYRRYSAATLAAAGRTPSRLTVAVLSCTFVLNNALSAEPLFDPTQPYGQPYGEPTAPHLTNTRAAPAPLQLEAILHGSQRRLAIVNGQLVHEGDRLAGCLIEAITLTSVRYSTQGRQHTLTLAGAILPVAQLSIRPTTFTQPTKDNQP